MAEMSFTCPVNSTASSNGGGTVDAQRRVLIRTAGPFAANTTLDVNLPGLGWGISGEAVTWSGSNDFVNNTQVYRNGQHLLTAHGSGFDNDVYFVAASGSIAFESIIQTNDVVQVWKFQATASG